MKAIGYFREPPPGKKGQSLAAQNRAFLEFCERQGYEVAATFVETGDGEARRDGFRQMVEYLKRPEKGFVIVVVRSPEALGRDIGEAARRYFQLEGMGAQVTFMSGAPSGDATSRLLEAWNSRQGRLLLGERVRAAMRRKAVRGEVLGRPPYGYKVGNRRRLELVAEEAVVVRYIFRLYLHEGLGIRLIARRLNEEGLKTRRNGNWSMVSIRDILRNRVYLGTYSRFGVRVPGSHPALISPDDFRAVQDRLNARRTSYSPRSATQFLLSGLIYCGYCGNKLIGVKRRQSWKRKTGEQGEGSYRYYQCESRTNQSMCDYHTRRAAELEAQVRDALAEAGASGASFRQAGDEAAVIAERQQECQQLRSRIRQLDRKLEGYMEAAAKGRISADRMRKLGLASAADRLALEEALEEAEQRAAQQASAAERRRERERSLARLLDEWDALSFGDRQALLREVVDRVTVHDDGLRVLLRP